MLGGLNFAPYHFETWLPLLAVRALCAVALTHTLNFSDIPRFTHRVPAHLREHELLTKCTSVSDMAQHSKASLVKVFGVEPAEFIYSTARGVDTSPVVLSGVFVDQAKYVVHCKEPADSASLPFCNT